MQARTIVIGSCVFPDLEHEEMITQVQRGMQLLDSNRPAGWENSIYLPDLDINSGCTCILGQVYGPVYATGFVEAVHHLFGFWWCRDVSEAYYQLLVDHGFAVDRAYHQEGEPPKLQLEMVWKVFLQQRTGVYDA
jgi:hypothetical protein